MDTLLNSPPPGQWAGNSEEWYHYLEFEMEDDMESVVPETPETPEEWFLDDQAWADFFTEWWISATYSDMDGYGSYEYEDSEEFMWGEEYGSEEYEEF